MTDQTLNRRRLLRNAGATALGDHLRRHPVARLHLLLSHFHHDHLIGLHEGNPDR